MRSQNPRRERAVWKRSLFYLALTLLTLFFLFPIIWMAMASFKTQVDNLATPPVVLFEPTLENYRETFIRNPFPRYTWNSFVVAAASTAIGVVVGAPAAFSIARFRQRGLAVVILAARIMPAISYLLMSSSWQRALCPPSAICCRGIFSFCGSRWSGRTSR
ncbi:MAG: hypothetical protein AAGU78_07785 [Chloroflexota bacterium]